MKWKKSSALSLPASTAFDERLTVPILPIDNISKNAISMFATIFNLLPDGITTFASVSPSLEEISFSTNRSGKEISWGDDFEEFMDAFVCRLALTGKAILTVTSFPDDELRLQRHKRQISLVVQGWMVTGDASSPVAFDSGTIKSWYRKYGRIRPDSKIKFVTGYSL